MKNLLIYTFCFFALLACKKSERLQDEYTIVSGIVSEVQRGIPIEGATVVFQEFLEDEKTDDCFGSCSRLLDSVLTDVNGYYEFNFNAKKGANWGYNITCRKLNYIVRQESYSPHLIKEKANTANLSLIATGGLEVVLYNHVGKEWQIWLGNGYDYGVNPDTINIIESKNSQAFSEFIITAYYCRKPMCDEKKYQQESYEILPNQTVKDTIHFYGN